MMMRVTKILESCGESLIILEAASREGRSQHTRPLIYKGKGWPVPEEQSCDMNSIIAYCGPWSISESLQTAHSKN